jgi:hypothetical protein
MTNALDALKSVKESLSHNYTSYQLLHVLDTLLWRSVKPMLQTTRFMDRILANVLSWGATNPRRKLSSLPKDQFYTLLVAFLSTDDPKLKYKILKRLRLERNILFFAISRFLELTKNLQLGQNPPDIFSKLAVTDANRLWFASRELRYWGDLASTFKGWIIEKYMRYVMLEASTFYRQQLLQNPHLTFDQEDIAQNFILVVDRAINKCDPNQGTLTAYIQTWLRDAKTNPHFRGEYGMAYSIPASQRRRLAQQQVSAVNISVCIDDESLTGLSSDHDIEADYERRKQVEHIRLLAKRADPHGIARLFLGIGEHLDSSEHQQLSNHLATNLEQTIESPS